MKETKFTIPAGNGRVALDITVSARSLDQAQSTPDLNLTRLTHSAAASLELETLVQRVTINLREGDDAEPESERPRLQLRQSPAPTSTQPSQDSADPKTVHVVRVIIEPGSTEQQQAYKPPDVGDESDEGSYEPPDVDEEEQRSQANPHRDNLRRNSTLTADLESLFPHAAMDCAKSGVKLANTNLALLWPDSQPPNSHQYRSSSDPHYYTAVTRLNAHMHCRAEQVYDTFKPSVKDALREWPTVRQSWFGRGHCDACGILSSDEFYDLGFPRASETVETYTVRYSCMIKINIAYKMANWRLEWRKG